MNSTKLKEQKKQQTKKIQFTEQMNINRALKFQTIKTFSKGISNSENILKEAYEN